MKKNSTITVYECQDNEWIEREINLNDIPYCAADDFEDSRDFCQWANGCDYKVPGDNGSYWIEPLN